MADKEWQISCPHCQRSFVQDENQIGGSNMRAALLVLKGRPDARELLENYVIHCPGCEQLIPFEPRSRYRQRKELAVQQRLSALAALPSADEADRHSIDIAGKFGEIFHHTLQTDMPLGTIREMADDIFRVVASEAEAGEPVLKDGPAMRLLRDIIDIACADIGERNDLPEAPVDEVEEKRAALLRAIDDLNDE